MDARRTTLVRSSPQLTVLPAAGRPLPLSRLLPASSGLLVLALLVLLVLTRLGWSVASIAAPGEVEFGEALIHDHAARIVRGEPLYQSVYQPAFTVASYTPVYYHAVAALQVAFGPGFLPGRILSLAGGLSAAGLVALLAARRAADWRAGVLAAGFFVALGLPGQRPWWALYKEDVLGLALALGSIAVLGGGGGSRRRVLAAAVLAALAFLTKQTLIAAGLAGFVWLMLRRDWRATAAYAFVGLAVAAGSVALFQATTGAFFTNVVQANANPLRLSALGENLCLYARFQAGLVAVAALVLLVRARGGTWVGRADTDALLPIYWAASAIIPLAGFGKVGSYHNYWLELAAATAALAAAALVPAARRWQATPPAVAPHLPLPRLGLAGWLAPLGLLLIGANAAWALRAADAPALLRRGLVPTNSEVASFDALVRRVRSEPREVIADPPDVVTLAGRRILFEPWAMSLLYQQHAWGWSAAPLVHRICAGDVGLLVLAYPVESDGPAMHGVSRWAPPLISALRAAMVLDTAPGPGPRYVYVPRAGGPAGGCEAGSG